jgi:hypothetical protein
MAWSSPALPKAWAMAQYAATVGAYPKLDVMRFQLAAARSAEPRLAATSSKAWHVPRSSTVPTAVTQPHDTRSVGASERAMLALRHCVTRKGEGW